MKFSTHFIAAGLAYATFEKIIPAPLFRSSFTLPETAVREAGLTICGLGFYELYVNGQRITKSFLAPYISNPDDYLYYDYYDITTLLRPGENVIGILLGNGMQNAFGGAIWDFHKARFRSAPKVALDFAATLADDTSIHFEADESFVCTESPIIMNDLRAGEWYDARLEVGDWTTPGYDDSAWRKPIPAETPRGECRLCDIDPIIATAERTATEIYPSKISYYANCDPSLPVIPMPEDEQIDTGYLYDFGINAAGICRLHIRNARPGQKIVLQYGEKMMDGGLDIRIAKFLPRRYGHRDIYICKGGDETWTPTFTYHGFRYVLVSGITEEQATPELLTYVILHTKMEKRAFFHCSDEMTNRIWDAVMTSNHANFFHYPTDCPQREKIAWTGDAALSAEQMVFTMSPERNWREWLRNVRKTQSEAGSIPGIIPTTGWGYGLGVAFENVHLILPYYALLYRGNTDLCQENAAAILRYLYYLSTHRNRDGLLEFGLGDWVPAGRGLDYRSTLAFTSTVLAMDYAAKAAEIFSTIGMKAEAEYAGILRNQLYDTAREFLIDTRTMTALGRCQTSQAMAIHYDLFTEAEKPLAVERLLAMIEDKNGSFDCGILGLRVLFHVLSAYGHTDIAHRMITKTTFPSYGYEIANGATSLWECFSPADREQSSLNHHFWGDVVSWFLQNLAGIQVNPYHRDPTEIRFCPRFIDTLDCADGKYQSVAGEVAIHWERDSEEILCRCVVPHGASAEFVCDMDWQLDDGFTHKRFSGTAEFRLIRENNRDRMMKYIVE